MTGAAEPEIDLSICAREPIHIPGAIQPHGAMLVLDGESFDILQAAGDTAGLLGHTLDQLAGRNAALLFRPAQMARLREINAEPELHKPRHLLDPVLRVSPDRPLDASAHRSDGLLVLEFEAADPAERHAGDPLGAVQQVAGRLDATGTLAEFCEAAAAGVRALAGYDRAMVYRFLEDGTGQVIAESRIASLPPLLGLHYPASDIPAQARALYLTNQLRIVARADYVPAPLVPAVNPRTRRPLDMSQAILRDVSPVHREYLRNMGVAATMTISLVVEGRLWGLIACHHGTPRALPRHLRAACELIASICSLQLEVRERSRKLEARLANRAALHGLARELDREDDPVRGLRRQAQALLHLIEAGGVALHSARDEASEPEIATFGLTPGREQIAPLAAWLSSRLTAEAGLFASASLGELWPAARAFADRGAGVLAVSPSRRSRDMILWFRPELVATVQWGGDPGKPAEAGPDGARLSPRRSFEAWQEIVRGRSAPWTPAEREAAFDLRVALTEIMLKRSETSLRAQESLRGQQDLLVRELDHRVKNVLANVQSLVRQSSRSANSLARFVTALEGRIDAMARAQSLLTESRWERVSIRRAVEEVLAPWRAEGGVITCGGPDIELLPRAALALALALHELGTNAAKYGSLGAAGGRLAVEWRHNDARGVEIEWREEGGPPVKPPRRRGFGSTLIERALALETGGHSKITFEPTGVRCRIVLAPTSLAPAAPDAVA